MSWLAALNPVALGANLLTGGLNYLGQKEANRTNKEIADQTTNTNIAEAKLNREFQERMSSSAFQRAKDDLKKAGLNPLLMSPSGASTPSGATATGVQATMQNELGELGKGLEGATATALQLKNLGTQAAQQESQATLNEKQGYLAVANARKAIVETAATAKDIPQKDLKNKIIKTSTKFYEGLKNSARQLEMPVRVNHELTRSMDERNNSKMDYIKQKRAEQRMTQK